MEKEAFVGFKLTENERRELQEHAKREGVSLSEYCRTRCFEYRHKEIPMLELPSGERIKVGELQKARIVMDLP